MNSANFEFGGFWRRTGALMIDGIFVTLIALVFKVFAMDSVGLGVLIGILYQPFFDASELQGTPGKALLDLRVTDMDGQRISFKKSFIRYIMRIVSSVMACLGFLFYFFTEKKQTLHDLAAGTLVVRGEVKDLNYFQAWYHQVLEVLGMVDKVPAKRQNATSPTTEGGLQATPADLAGLYELFRKGILTEAEYNQKREDILKKL